MAERTDADTSANIWLRPRRATRERSVNRERIVEAAIALLDADGPDRLTMRRLAEQLGTGSTTLYWHVETKDDVLDLAHDAIVGEIPVPGEPSPRWRDDALAFAVAWRATMLRHPWTATLLGRPLLGPNVLQRLEFLQRTLSRAGLASDAVQAATWALISQVMGSAAAEVTFAMHPADRRRSVDLIQSQRDRYPLLAAAGYGSESDWTANFVRGIEFVLDGIESAAAGQVT